MVEGEIRGETDPLKTDKRQNLKTGSDVINEKNCKKVQIIIYLFAKFHENRLSSVRDLACTKFV